MKLTLIFLIIAISSTNFVDSRLFRGRLHGNANDNRGSLGNDHGDTGSGQHGRFEGKLKGRKNSFQVDDETTNSNTKERKIPQEKRILTEEEDDSPLQGLGSLRCIINEVKKELNGEGKPWLLDEVKKELNGEGKPWLLNKAKRRFGGGKFKPRDFGVHDVDTNGYVENLAEDKIEHVEGKIKQFSIKNTVSSGTDTPDAFDVEEGKPGGISKFSNTYTKPGSKPTVSSGIGIRPKPINALGKPNGKKNVTG